MSDPIFNVGDVVKIVDTPFYECPFGWVGSMTSVCGRECTITEVGWHPSKRHHYYRTNRLPNIMWCKDCLEEIDQTNLEESDFDIETLFK